METSRTGWSSVTKIVVSVLLLALGVYLLSRFSTVLAPFILALILAYVLSPVVSYLQVRLKVGRTPAALLAYLFLFVLVIVLPLAIVPPLVSQSVGLNLDIQRILLQVDTMLENKISVDGIVIPVDEIFAQAASLLEGIFEPVVGQTLSFLVDVISSAVWVIFILIVSFYLIKDGPALRAWFENLAPPTFRNDFIRLRDEINQIWGAFFRGQLVLALVVAVIFTVAGFLLGMPFALAMGVFAGILEFLPSIGHGIWLAVASVLALFAGSTWIHIPNWAFMLIIIGLHIVYQQFDLNYLIPRIIGRSVHLPPLVVILGIVSGAVLAGVLGVLLAAPTIASARVLGRYIYANLFDLEPFPGTVAPLLPPPNAQWWRKPPPGKTTNVTREM